MESESPVDKWLLWIGVGMVALSFVRSRRHIPYSFLLGAGLNVLNNWLMVGIDEERNPHAVSDKKTDQNFSEHQTQEHSDQTETGMQYH
ncbi:MAG: hypothetical protein RI984_1468 [Pseudomonadota bacterium]